MALREVDALSDVDISNAIISTEKEIAGFAWGTEETDALDETGDKSLEDIGGGLEGQHDAEDDLEEVDEEGEGEDEVDETEPKPDAAKPVEAEKPAAKPVVEPEGRVPPGRLREANERARALETERDALKASFDKREADSKAQLDLVMREIAALKTAPRTEAKAVEPPKAEVVPDIFENPTGFIEHITKGFQSELSKRDQQLKETRVETSMAIAHAFHKDAFEKAWESVNKLDPRNPQAQRIVGDIYNSPNPGEALVNWHKRNETFARVGDDPTKFEADIRKAEREALMKDPEFIKLVAASLRGDAMQGDNGQPRTTTRLPKSLARAGGSNLGADPDRHASNDSEQAVADAAWR